MLNIERVVAVQNYGPSGTSLLHSLLDDHPQVISTLMLQDYGIYYHLWDEISYNPTVENIFQVVRKRLYSLFNADYGDPTFKQMGESKNERLEVRESDFKYHLQNYFKSSKVITRKEFIVGVFVAYNLCHGRKFSDDAIICFPIHSHSQQYAGYLTQDFREVYFLHMVREPVQNIGSQIKYVAQCDRDIDLFKSLLDCAVLQIFLEKSYHFHHNPVEMYGKRPYFEDVNSDSRIISSRAVRLEDIHLNPRETLQKICDWISIDFHDCLMRSTFMGKLWHNRVGFVRVSGFSKEVIEQKYPQYLNWFDRYRLRLLSKTESRYFKYYEFSPIDHFIFYFFLPFSLLLPFKIECNKERFLSRLNAILSYIYSRQNCYEWIVENYNKKDFVRKLDEKLAQYCDVKTRNSIKGWVTENHRKNNFTQNLISLLKRKSVCTVDPKIVNWIIKNDNVYVAARDKNYDRQERLRCFLTFFSELSSRLFLNYYNVRKNMLKMWCYRLFNCKDPAYIKMLYDIKT
jgi:hypothetical protein